MKLSNRIVSNTMDIFTIDIVSKIIGMGFMIYAARVLGVKEFGTLILIGTVINLLNMFSAVGIRPMAIREIAKNKDQGGKYINNVLGLRLILASVSYMILILVVLIVDYEPRVNKLLYIMGLSMFPEALVNTFGIVYIAKGVDQGLRKHGQTHDVEQLIYSGFIVNN